MSGEVQPPFGREGITNASSVVLARLHTVTSHHASALASVSTVAAAATPTPSGSFGGCGGRRKGGVRAPSSASRPSALATVAHRRSKCSQPPFDCDTGTNGAGSAAPVLELDLNPPERVPPHRIVPGVSEVDDAAATGDGLTAIDGGELPATNAARKAIAALATLVDESNELEVLAERRILPPLALFGIDLESSSSRSGSTPGTAAAAAVLEEMDDDTMNRRDAELLRRVGRFVPTLQETFNFTLRCRRLVRNMVCQIGGCASPPVGAVDGDKGGTVRPAAVILGPDVRLVPLAEAMAKLLRVLIAIDETVGGNSCLAEGWELYKHVMQDRAVRMQQEAQTNGEENDAQKREREELESFERMLVQLDFTLLSCRSFVTAIEQNFDPGCHYVPNGPEESPSASGKGGRSSSSEDRFTLYGEVKAHVIDLYDRCCRRIGTTGESNEADLTVGVYGLYCLYRRILPSHLIPDAKLHRALWMNIPSKRPAFPLFANAAFLPREFMMRYAPYEGLRGCTPPADPVELRQDAMAQVSDEAQKLSAAAKGLQSEALKWAAAADMDLAPHPSSVSGPGGPTKKEEPAITVEKTVTRITEGVRLARRASLLLHNFLISHYALDMAIKSDHLPALMALCEIVKSIERLLCVRRRSSVISTQRAAVKLYASSLFRLFQSLRLATDHYNASIDHEAGAESSNIARITACLTSLEGLLKGTTAFSQGRCDAISVSLSCCANPGAHDFRFESPDKARQILNELRLMSGFDIVLRRVCDLSFLYFQRDLFVRFARSFYQQKGGVGIDGFQLVCSAFSDASDGGLLLLSPPDRNDGFQNAKKYRDFLIGTIQEEMVVPICQVIDSELRLAALARSPQQRKQNNPKMDRAAKIRQLLDMPGLRVCESCVSVKDSVQQYLDNLHYVMSAIAMDDNAIYSEMKGTVQQFGLVLADKCLPLGGRGGGADIIELSDNLSMVVQGFTYDMSQNIFVEKRPTEKRGGLACISASRLELSIQQHGQGVVNRSVSIAYTLLWEKFETLSQMLLGNDKLLSLLAKEARWYREIKGKCGATYPFGRASSFSEEIASVGKQAEVNTSSFLDHLRSAITQIGNTVAFVKLLWAAEARKNEEGGASTKLKHRAAKYQKLPTDNENLDVLQALSDLNNFAEGQQKQLDRQSSLLKLLCKDFQRDMKAADYAHMQNFAMSVPALSLNWLEALQRGKEMMHKQNLTSDVYFVDDGFALGIAFVLFACDLFQSFDSLHWFAAINYKQDADEKSLTELRAEHDERERLAAVNKKGGAFFSFARTSQNEDDTATGTRSTTEDGVGEEERGALSLSWKMFESRKREIRSLFCTLQCSRSILAP